MKQQVYLLLQLPRQGRACSLCPTIGVVKNMEGKQQGDATYTYQEARNI
jgi:hypothetical protein